MTMFEEGGGAESLDEWAERHTLSLSAYCLAYRMTRVHHLNDDQAIALIRAAQRLHVNGGHDFAPAMLRSVLERLIVMELTQSIAYVRSLGTPLQPRVLWWWERSYDARATEEAAMALYDYGAKPYEFHKGRSDPLNLYTRRCAARKSIYAFLACFTRRHHRISHCMPKDVALMVARMLWSLRFGYWWAP